MTSAIPVRLPQSKEDIIPYLSYQEAAAKTGLLRFGFRIANGRQLILDALHHIKG